MFKKFLVIIILFFTAMPVFGYEPDDPESLFVDVIHYMAIYDYIKKQIITDSDLNKYQRESYLKELKIDTFDYIDDAFKGYMKDSK